LFVIESIAHDEVVVDREAFVGDINLYFGAGRLMKERAHREARRLSSREVLEQVVHRQSRVDNVFHEDDVTIGDGGREVVTDLHHTRAYLGVAVAGDREEVHRALDIDRSDKVSEEHE
jgi:hypothetical protein